MLAYQQTAAPRILAYSGEFVSVFECKMTDMTYAGIPPVRKQLLEFLQRQGAAQPHMHMLLLTASEILTNLVKHPERKARSVLIKICMATDTTTLDIADDSSVFELFDAKCNSAMDRMRSMETLSESGYGLGCILYQHAHVTYTPKTISEDGLNHFTIQDNTGPSQKNRPLSKEKKTVFIVDDDPIALKIHSRMLEETYNVIPFLKAQDALQAFKKKAPDIIVSDLTMPSMDGAGLRRALTNIKGGSITPFIFLSGSTAEEVGAYVNQLGVDDFLQKPVAKERLINVIERLITRSQQVKNSLEGRFHQDVTNILKPSLPEKFLHWDIHTYSEAAESGGGDFTLHHTSDQSLFAILADVMGHGLTAKFFAYAYAGYLHSIFRMHSGIEDPAQFLKRLSKSIEGDTFLESIILTCQSFQLFSDGRMNIASAGHPSPLIIDQSGCRSLDIAGPLLSLSSERGYPLKTLQLQAGEKVFFGTDGFFQVFDKSGYQYEELADILGKEPSNKSSADIAHMIWQSYNDKVKFSTQNKDDATFIIAEYKGENI